MKNFITQIACAALLAIFAVPAIGQDALAPTLAQHGDSGDKVYIKVTRNRDITGNLVDLSDIKVKTSFAEISVPLAKISGIKMNATPDGSAIIAFKNGDTITGNIVLEMIKLETDWGQAHVNTSQIETVTSSENGRFYNDTSGGKSIWRFSNDPPIPASNVNSIGPN